MINLIIILQFIILIVLSIKLLIISILNDNELFKLKIMNYIMNWMKYFTVLNFMHFQQQKGFNQMLEILLIITNLLNLINFIKNFIKIFCSLNIFIFYKDKF